MTKTSGSLWLKRDVHIGVMNELAQSSGWKLVDDQVRRHTTPTSRRWETNDGSTVTWVEDHTLGVQFVHVSDASLLTMLSSKLPHETREETLKAAQRPLPGSLVALRLLTRMELGKPLSAELGALLRAGIKHKNPIVKRAIARLVLTGAWTELRPDVARAESSDSEQRHIWTETLEVLDRLTAARPS